jgi:hypothetical protein
MVMAWVSIFLVLLGRWIYQLSTRRSLTRLIFFQTMETYKNLWSKYGKFNSFFSLHKGPFSKTNSLYKRQPFFVVVEWQNFFTKQIPNYGYGWKICILCKITIQHVFNGTRHTKATFTLSVNTSSVSLLNIELVVYKMLWNTKPSWY